MITAGHRTKIWSKLTNVRPKSSISSQINASVFFISFLKCPNTNNPWFNFPPEPLAFQCSMCLAVSPWTLATAPLASDSCFHLPRLTYLLCTTQCTHTVLVRNVRTYILCTHASTYMHACKYCAISYMYMHLFVHVHTYMYVIGPCINFVITMYSIVHFSLAGGPRGILLEYISILYLLAPSKIKLTSLSHT